MDMRKASFVVLAAALLLLEACGSSAGETSSRPEPAGATGSTSSIARTGEPGIRLPAGSTFSLPQEPGSGTEQVMIDGVYALLSEGTVVTAVAGVPAPVKTTEGYDITATPLRVTQVLTGKPSADKITLLAGQQEQGLTAGSSYLLVLSGASDSDRPTDYTAWSLSSVLKDNGDGRWTSLDGSVTVTLDGMRSILKESEEHLASRRQAGAAKLDLQVVKLRGGSKATVTGYAKGESLGIKFCHPSQDPATPPGPQLCDAMFAETVTPKSTTQTFEFTPPTEIRLSPEQATPCKNDCVLLVYDLDFPARVFATARL